MSTPTQMNVDEGRPVACDNCEWKGVAGLTCYIADLASRLDPGTGTVPAGECPDCGSLAYVTDTPERGYVAVLALIASFDKQCKAAEYTDTGEVWEVFGRIKALLRGS